MLSLPIDSFIPAIVDAARASRAVVVTAEPGAGKTTRVPPALLTEGAVLLLQPRRVAARAIAQRIADERHWTVGREIGWQIRFERRFGPGTRLLVATEGILTARLQEDPLLSSFSVIVLDEFHERSIHADLGLALAKQAWRARTDLHLVVMSATLDTRTVSAYLDDCPIVNVPGRTHPLAIDYAPGETAARAAADLLGQTRGDVLCFLPGASEIRRAIGEAQSIVGSGVDLVPLYGALDSAEQDRALRESPSGRRRVVVATNIAETSVTVPGITAVVDSGLHKVARYDADRSIDSLTTERITQDSADQRAGRAGRLAPGVVRRLWDAHDRLRPRREAEIHRVDLSSLVLDVVAWGGDPRELEWFDPPRLEAVDAAVILLERLGAVHAGKLTDVGRQMQRLPLHPRLARMLIAAKGARSIAQACALVSERQFFSPRAASTTSDLLSAVDDWAAVPPHVQRVAREIERIASALDSHGREDPPDMGEIAAGSGPRKSSARQSAILSDDDFRRAVFAGYPDRVGQRREAGSVRVKLGSGSGAVVGPQSGVRDGEFLVAIDLLKARGSAPAGSGASARGRPRLDSEGESLIRVASRVEREWLIPNNLDVVHQFDLEAGVVRAAAIERYDALTLTERAITPDVDRAADLLAKQWLAHGPRDEDRRLIARLKFAGQPIDLPAAIRTAAHGVRSVGDVRIERALSAASLRALERDAPNTLVVPSGRSARLEYGEDGTVTASVKLQELFGLAETPLIGPRREPVLFALLAPNGRPVQMTRDLKSFWARTYPDIRKELRGRYPKHPWPEDPWTATPTARTTKRRT